MDKSGHLIPGYTEQCFSLLRSDMYQGADEIKSKNKVLGAMSGFSVSLLDRALNYIEMPCRALEDVALTAINLVGAAFSEGCHENLNRCFFCLAKDIRDISCVALCVLFPPLGIVIAGYHVVGALFDAGADLDEKDTKEQIKLYRTKAMRIHGYANIINFERQLKNREDHNGMLKIFMNLADEIQEGKDFQAYCNCWKEFEGNPTPQKVQEKWRCPNELKDVDTEEAKTIKRILEIEVVDTSKMKKPQLKTHICRMLGIASNADTREINKQRHEISRMLHPDKKPVFKEHAEQAFKRFTDAWGVYQA